MKEARDSIHLLESKINALNKEVESLRYPADQRLVEIKELISKDDFSTARNKIAELKESFPLSDEAKACDKLLEQMSEKEKKIKAEQERLKALGFKAIKPTTTVEIGENKVVFSNLSFSPQFIHDSYDSRYFYNTADRGNVYALADMSVTSSSKNPLLPTLAIYSVNGDVLKLEGTYKIEFARWSDYGSYLGNYHDNRNDFAKTSTVRFKLGAEVPELLKTNPYIVVVKMSNTQVRSYDRFANPPYSYSGDAEYPSTLRIDNFNNGSYKVVKIANL